MLYNKDWGRPHTNPLSEMMLRAADLLEKYGHTKRTLREHNGSMCIMGALNMAHHGDADYQFDPSHLVEASKIIAEMQDVRDLYGGCSCVESKDIANVVAWNNAPGRTAQEVIDALRLGARAATKENA